MTTNTPELPPPDPSKRLESSGADEIYSPRSLTKTWILGLLLGFFGADRFYLTKNLSAWFKLLTIGGFFIWWIVDLWLLIGSPKDRDNLPLRPEPKLKLVMIAANAVATAVAASLVFSITG